MLKEKIHGGADFGILRLFLIVFPIAQSHDLMEDRRAFIAVSQLFFVPAVRNAGKKLRKGCRIPRQKALDSVCPRNRPFEVQDDQLVAFCKTAVIQPCRYEGKIVIGQVKFPFPCFQHRIRAEAEGEGVEISLAVMHRDVFLLQCQDVLQMKGRGIMFEKQK